VTREWTRENVDLKLNKKTTPKKKRETAVARLKLFLITKVCPAAYLITF